MLDMTSYHKHGAHVAFYLSLCCRGKVEICAANRITKTKPSTHDLPDSRFTRRYAQNPNVCRSEVTVESVPNEDGSTGCRDYKMLRATLRLIINIGIYCYLPYIPESESILLSNTYLVYLLLHRLSQL